MHGLAGVFMSMFAQRILVPGVETNQLMDAQGATHRLNRGQQAMLGNERVSHLASLDDSKSNI